jgi:serralysin
MLRKFGQETFAGRAFSETVLDPMAFGQSAAAAFAFASPVHSMLPSKAQTTAKLADAFPVDGMGDLRPPLTAATLVVTPDEAGNGKGVAPGNPTITVGAPSYIGTINTNGDEDYFQVNLVAGQTYEIGMYSYTGGPSTVPLADCYIELYAADGTSLIVSADGGANTPQNDVNSGFDVLLVFEAETTGTYYINARAFDNDPTDGTTGEGVGDYELFARVQDPNDPNVYHPYYDVDSPLYAIDWGTQVNKVHQSVRNPDGDEGTRNTGNPQGTVDYSDATSLQALAAAQGKDITDKNVITIYFAREGDVFVSNDPTNPGLPPATITAVAIQDFEHTAVMTALHEFEKVADVVYLEVDNQDDADFIYTSYQGTPGPGVSLLGSMSPPDESDEGLAQFNSGDERWNARDLAQGGFSFVTLIHEFGHGHGLAHPHDNGGHSGIMRGVEEESPFNYTTGDYELNQGVFTMMSYEDGWQSSPYGNADTDVGYGYLGGLSAFDIAAIQDKYGVNEDWATGNDTYELKDVNAPGTYFTAIWDGGGSGDRIIYRGDRDANIDLRAASLEYEYGGGGWVSYAYGIFGGFTIANGVVIENATSGGGNDTLRGNSANNYLDARGGNDTIWLMEGGNDQALGGLGDDVFLLGAAMTSADMVDGGTGSDQIILQGNYNGPTAITFGSGVVGLETLTVLPGNDTRYDDPGGGSYDYNVTTVDANVAAGLRMLVDGSRLRAGEDFTFNGAAETNGSFHVLGGAGVDRLTGGANNDVFRFGAGQFGAGDKVTGGAGIDQLVLRGNHTITFGATQMSGMEKMLLESSGIDASGTGPRYSYNLVMNDANVPGGIQMLVDASALKVTERLTFNGAAETNGSFEVLGGQIGDVIIGSQRADILQGNNGGDTMTGGGGADVFRYMSRADSRTGTGIDQILDFTPGSDKIDLAAIDANSWVVGDQAWHWIGAAAFSGAGAAGAGELRAVFAGGSWTVEGDFSGDGVADLTINLTTVGAAPLTQADFVL